MDDVTQLGLLGVSLAIGLMIGIERGWQARDVGEGRRIAGLRTYGLIGLLGGMAALLAEQVGSYVLGLTFLGLAIALTAAYLFDPGKRQDVSITSLITGLLTFAFGALAVTGNILVASSAAVVTTLLLSLKSVLHRWLWLLEQHELWAALQLLLISLVVLPILPNEGYGPWQALNPYKIWWMVVLISGISFLGYFAMKIAGATKGVMLTALSGGLVSSTALTLQFSRMARSQQRIDMLLSTGILFACGTMFPRMVLVATVINPKLLQYLWLPALVMALLTYMPAAYWWFRGNRDVPQQLGKLPNPLYLKSALTFGALLALILLLSRWLQEVMGEAGIYLLAAASGIADVDPINLSLAGMSKENLNLTTAAQGIVIAGAMNSVVKGGMAGFIGGRSLLQQVMLPLWIAAGGGVLISWLYLI